ncbi:hypothetical protein U1Q18_009415 [Sarracenia purpurea var. burkii]
MLVLGSKTPTVTRRTLRRTFRSQNLARSTPSTKKTTSTSSLDHHGATRPSDTNRWIPSPRTTLLVPTYCERKIQSEAKVAVGIFSPLILVILLKLMGIKHWPLQMELTLCFISREKHSVTKQKMN